MINYHKMSASEKTALKEYAIPNPVTWTQNKKRAPPWSGLEDLPLVVSTTTSKKNYALNLFLSYILNFLFRIEGKKYMKKSERKQLISVVMPVYNAGGFLVEAIESILHQTYKHIEFIIVDGGSDDNSWKIIKKYAKRYKQIRAYKSKKRLGLSETVKLAISHVKGKYIARMDADDVALPKRMAKQLVYLIENQQTVAIGSQCYVIDKNGHRIGQKKFPIKFEQIYDYIFKFIPLQQPTLMVAKERLPINFEYYKDGLNTAEEVELLFKLFQYGKVENLPEYLLNYRIHDKNTSFKNIRMTFLLTLVSRFKAIVVYNYRPSISGVLITLLEIPLVLLFPKKFVFWLYELTRKILLVKLPKSIRILLLKNNLSINTT